MTAVRAAGFALSALAIGVSLLTAGCAQTPEHSEGSFAELQREHEEQALGEHLVDRDQLVACLISDGFESDEIESYIRGVDSAEPAAYEFEVDRLLAVGGEEEVAARLGFGFAPLALLWLEESEGEVDIPQDTPEETSSDPVLASAFDKCAASSGYSDPPPSTTEFSDTATEIDERVRADSEWRAIEADWLQCMAEGGYNVSDVNSLHVATSLAFDAMQKLEPLTFSTAIAAGEDGMETTDQARFAAVDIYGSANSWSELAALEIQVATYEYGCRQRIDHDQRVTAIRDRVTVDYLDQ